MTNPNNTQTYHISQNTIDCIGFDVSVDEDGQGFYEPCSCDTCIAKSVPETGLEYPPINKIITPIIDKEGDYYVDGMRLGDTE